MARDTLDSEQIFGFLRSDQINILSEAADKVEFKTGETIYNRGDPASHFYVILSGIVALRLPGKQIYSLLIDDLSPGSMFGSCVSFSMETYTLTAQCARDCQLLKVATSALKDLLDSDPRMGYAIQSRISEIYFKRYIETMKKLQAIVMNIPLDAS
jgi:CRP-like cAMP-binding protein